MEQWGVKSEIERSEVAGTTAAVSLSSVAFSFPSSAGGIVPVLKSATLRLEYGQVVGVIGRNGAGKTTLLNIIRGELVPQDGTVTVGGSVVSRDGHRIRLPNVSLVSQRPDVGLAPTMTVYENFVMASRGGVVDLRMARSRTLKVACLELLSRSNIGLEAKLHEQVRFLSGGQQQALSVLLALISAERVVLMDEPTASLDEYATKELFEMTLREARLSQTLVVIVSHRLRELVERCQRILAVSDGRVVLDIAREDAGWNEESLFCLLTSK